MTPQMIDKARANIDHYTKTTGLNNVEFRLGEIEHLPVADSSVDVIISNCVLNLSMDKQQVWNEISRVLKPGGRIAISDIALLCAVPAEVKTILEAWAGCVAGAIPIEDMRQQMQNAGMENISLTPKPHYVNALTAANDPLYAKVTAILPDGQTAEEVITSLDVQASKPDESCCSDGCCS
jgi:SAM-dependent methyltransferase